MQWIFLIPFGSGLISAYFTLRYSDEITSFTGVFTLICWLISLWIAPWEFQLLILILGIAIARYSLRQMDAQIDVPLDNDAKKKDAKKKTSPIKNNPTSPVRSTSSNFFRQKGSPNLYQRVYRGIADDPDPKAAGDTSVVDLDSDPTLPQLQQRIYRGVPYKMGAHSVGLPQKATPSHGLKYRGVTISPQPDDSSQDV